jgi:hypothetical protein
MKFAQLGEQKAYYMENEKTDIEELSEKFLL